MSQLRTLTRTEVVCYVGRFPKRRSTSYLRSTIREALSDHLFLSLRFADDQPMGPDGFAENRLLIDRAAFCIFEVSGSRRSDALLELGYALGREKPSTLLQRRGDRCAASLAAEEKVYYSSARQLRHALEKVSIYPHVLSFLGEPDGALLSLIAAKLLDRGSLGPEGIFEVSREYGCSDLQAIFNLQHLGALGLVVEDGTDWRLTFGGRRCLPRLIAEIPPP